MSADITLNRVEIDWVKFDALSDQEIDYDDAPALSAEMLQAKKPLVRRGLKPLPQKKQITLRLDEDIIAWFKQHERGYQTLINETLRRAMQQEAFESRLRQIIRKELGRTGA